MTVGFIGLGNMGGHMARSLLRAGRRVVVSDVSAEAMRSLEKAGAVVADSPAAVATAVGNGSLVTMLPSGAIVRDVYQDALGAPGFAARQLIDAEIKGSDIDEQAVLRWNRAGTAVVAK